MKAKRSQWQRLIQTGCDSFRHNNRVASLFGEAFQTRGGIDGVADCRIVVPVFCADIADKGRAKVQADPDGDCCGASLGLFPVESRQLLEHFLCGEKCVMTSCGCRLRGAKKGHDAVADKFVQCASVAMDNRCHAVEVTV